MKLKRLASIGARGNSASRFYWRSRKLSVSLLLALDRLDKFLKNNRVVENFIVQIKKLFQSTISIEQKLGKVIFNKSNVFKILDFTTNLISKLASKRSLNYVSLDSYKFIMFYFFNLYY